MAPFDVDGLHMRRFIVPFGFLVELRFFFVSTEIYGFLSEVASATVSRAPLAAS